MSGNAEGRDACAAPAVRLLVVLVGIPGAGKSTTARQLQARIGTECAVRHVELDALLEQHPQAGFEPRAWKEVRATFHARVRGALRDCSQRGVVIADDTFHYKSMRRQCFQLASDAAAAYCQVFVRCPLETALQRNSGRPPAERVPAEVLERMHAVLEDPAGSACVWDRQTLVVSPEPDVEEVWASVRERWAAFAPRQPQPAAPAPAQRPAHEFDLHCRRTVSAAVRAAAPAQRAALAAALNRERQAALNSFRSRVAGSDLLQAHAAFSTRVEAAVEQMASAGSSGAQVRPVVRQEQ